MRIRRRQLLQALGLGGLSSLFHQSAIARADGHDLSLAHRLLRPAARAHPGRVEHGDPRRPGRPVRGAFAARPAADGFQPDPPAAVRVPRPPPRDRGPLAHLRARRHRRRRQGGDGRPEQPPDRRRRRAHRGVARSSSTGTYCTGGARSLDQELASRGSAPGRFDSRVYGFDYIPNSVVSPFSYLGPGQATPMVSDPSAAFADLLGYVTPVAAPTTPDRTSAVAPSVGARHGGPRVRPARAAARRGRAAEARTAPRARSRARAQPRGLSTVGPSAKCDTTFASTPAVGVNVGPVGAPVHEPHSPRVRVRSHAHRDLLGARSAVPGARVSRGRDVPRVRAPVDPRQHVLRADVQPARRAGDDGSRRVARGPCRVLAAAARLRGGGCRHAARSHRRRMGHGARDAHAPALRRVHAPRRRVQWLLRDRPLRALPEDSAQSRAEPWRSPGRRTTGCT